MATKDQVKEQAKDIELRLAKAMAHPVRVRILELMNERPIAAVEVSDEISTPLSNISYHFRTLLELECIEEVRKETVRGSIKTTYRSIVDLLVNQARWGGVEGKAMGELQRSILKQMANRVSDAIDAQTFERREDIHLTVQTVSMTEEQWTEVTDLLEVVMDRLAEITEEAQDDGVRFPVTVSAMAYESPRMYEQ